MRGLVTFLFFLVAFIPPAAATDRARLDAVLAHAIEVGRYPGISVAIEKDGRIVYEKGMGIADVETMRPVTPATVFPIGSITKSFTHFSVLKLADAGKISLADPVGHYLQDLKGPAAAVPLRHLLDHSSGIVNYTARSGYPEAEIRFGPEQVLAFLAGRALAFRPGERFSYSNSNSYLLGLIVEKVSGQPFADYLAENIFKPFGMTTSRLAGYRAIIPDRASGYEPAGQGYENAAQYDVDYPFSAGAIMATAADLIRYRRGLFEGNLTSQSIRDAIQAQRPLLDGTLNYYAWGALIGRAFEGHRKLSHSGVIEGFSAHYAYYPDDRLTIAVLTNLSHGAFMPYAIEHRLARIMLGLKEPAIVDRPVPQAEAEAFAGDYVPFPFTFDAGRFGFVGKDGRMFLRYEGVNSPAPLEPLLYLGDGRFVAAADHEHSFTFDTARPRARNVEIEFFDGRFPAARAPESSN
ncbi:serine hydrolase domain-containing protein [Sphingosinicella rhizophila]|uniref:Serine hydrolase domain-containing protein n=1 Tax=Sphingosinicella rhizophila TaxID=3050082 RepID=A0ABU3QBD8_9SPHN|nr:serine hydrolase domain-containing protein [Sphingosinicella sp. GR2756]MDT9600723.1 serine hydrolase domain-containing protein [Sphingosinicella sp. GR2756]